MRTKLSVLFFLFMFVLQAHAQIINPTHWTFTTSKPAVKTGETVELIFKIRLDGDWHMYSTDFDPNLGPKVAVFNFNPSPAYELVGKIIPVGAKEEYDDVFEGKVRLFHGSAEFRQKVKILADLKNISGSYQTQTCSDKAGRCVDQDEEFSFGPFTVTVVPGTKASPSKASPSTTPKTGAVSPVDDPAQPAVATSNAPPVSTDLKPCSCVCVNGVASGNAVNQASTTGSVSSESIDVIDPLGWKGEKKVVAVAEPEDESLIAFFIAAFLSGLAALLTPCVFPMIPMTVTFFTRQSKSRKEAIGKASLYGLSIILLYVLIGTLVSRINGPEFANFISTHWAPNLFFFLIFLIFGLSFLGLFEIVLPSSLVNIADRESDKGGIYGIFFMAFTIVLVSFSCTGPIVGSILVNSAGGAVLKPVIGMLGYSLAFALPFTLFAIFPQWLSSLPKSGGWLNSVKVVLGFIELAFALKFLSIPDLSYHWGILNRDIYLSLWIVIFALMGFYLLGRIRLPHDSVMEKVPVLRLTLAIVVLSFVIYMIPGMWGAPLRLLSGYLPPESTQEFVVGTGSNTAETKICSEPKYSSFLHLPHGIKGYFDIRQAIACAREQNKPVFIDFTGHGCVNCRKMEANVWSHPDVLQRLKSDFVVVALYGDDKTELPETQWFTSPYDGKLKKSVGKQNSDYQVRYFNSNTQPLYVILSPDGNPLDTRSYDPDVPGFVRFLDGAKMAIKK